MPNATAKEIVELKLVQLTPSPTNPRKYFDPAKLKDLADSIREQGVLTPIMVRKVQGSGGVKVNGLYEIIAGERRFRASKIAGRETVPAEVKEFDDKQVAEAQLIENVQRDDLSPLEEARAYKPLIDLHGYDIKAIAEKIGKSASYIYGCFRLMKLSPAWHKALDEGGIKMAFAHVVATRIEDHELQDEILEHLQDTYCTYSADTPEELRKKIEERHDRALKRAPWNTADKTLVPAAGPCTSCPHRSQAQAELFDGASKGDFCMKVDCWTEKMKAHGARLVDEARRQGKNVVAGATAKKVLAESKSGTGILVELDSSPGWYHRAGSLREGLKGRKVQVTLVQDEAGRLREMAPKADVLKAMPKEVSSGNSGGGGKLSAKEKAARRARLLDLAAARAAWPKAWAAAIDKLAAKGLNAIAFRQMLAILVRRHGDRHWTNNAAERLGIKYPGDDYGSASAKAISRWLEGKTEKDLVRAGWQLALGPGAWDSDTELSPSGKDVFDLAGVNYAAFKTAEARRITDEKLAKEVDKDERELAAKIIEQRKAEGRYEPKKGKPIGGETLDMSGRTKKNQKAPKKQKRKK